MFKKFINFIFSVTNENAKSNKVYKVFKFIGIKFKFRNYKAENKKLLKLNQKINLSNFNRTKQLKDKYKIVKEENKTLKNENNSLKKSKKKLVDKNKNYLDIIKKVPELYESEILLPKKQHLDEVRTSIALKEIQDIMSAKEFPLPISVEIETINRCNGGCDFCPVNAKDDSREFKLMEEELFYNILYQLKDLRYNGRIQLFSNNEPLMDKRIFEFAKKAKEILPNNHFSFFTNGTLLTLDKFNRLEPYCDTFCIDIYYDDTESIPENIHPIIDLCISKPELQNKVKVNFINKHAIRNNRGSQSKNRKKVYQLKCPCLLPFKQLIIRPDGKISLCCNDALGHYTLGDLNKNSILEVWNNNFFKDVREQLKDSRDKIEMCKYCDNFGGCGTNQAKDYVYTEKEYLQNWEYIKSTYYLER